MSGGSISSIEPGAFEDLVAVEELYVVADFPRYDTNGTMFHCAYHNKRLNKFKTQAGVLLVDFGERTFARIPRRSFVTRCSSVAHHLS